MTILEIVDLIGQAINNPRARDHLSVAIWIVVLGSAFLEFSRIKVRPYTWLLKKIGKIMNSDLKEEMNTINGKINDIEKRQTDLEYKEELKDVLYARRRILRANDEICNHIDHTKEFFNEVLADIQAYEQYCELHKNPNDPQYFRNDKCTESIHNIRRVYRELETTNNFLVVGKKN